MTHPGLIHAMTRQPAFAKLREQLPTPADRIPVSGLAGSSPALLLAALASSTSNRLWVAVTNGPTEADALEADLGALLDGEQATLYPQREALPFEAAEPHLEVAGLRVEALEALLSGRARILVTTVRALQERASIPREIAELRLTFNVGDTVPLRQLAARLDELGFQRTALVEGVGEYALRGGIIDLFGFGAPDPVRVELWGDEIVSIRHFDMLDQRSTREVPHVDILPVDLDVASRAHRQEEQADSVPVPRSILDVLPRDALLVELETGQASDHFRRGWDELRHLHETERRRGGDPDDLERLFLTPDEALDRLGRFGRVTIEPGTGAELCFDTREPEPIDRDMDRLSALLREGEANGEDTIILCDNSGQLERLEEILGSGANGGRPAATLALGAVARGFILQGARPRLRVLTDHQIFRRGRRLRRGRRFSGTAAIESLAQLNPGDFVVHLDHGIGRFNGLERVRVGETEIEALAIEYAGGEILRLPIYRLDLIERWVPDREEGPAPRVHKIGGKAWRTLRQKTERAIRDMTAELLQLYAAREMAEGYTFSADTRWQKEMESSFLYEDTPDQRQVTLEVKGDMESRRPMDRLLCGDVGYGKTEVAIRAAFKALQDGKQVAVLAPTTILVEQHSYTFRERLADYPVRVESLSRFRPAAEQHKILAGLAAGEVDVLIGTHRMLEPDVLFKDIGLLIVDEEQRFGVRQKERLKEFRRNLDVLALSATPIPRTLHLSMAGLRDLSLLQTPPRDRMPILTHVVPWADEVIEDAILRELDRGGQIFFVHNRIRSIDEIARRVERMVPEASVAVAHGQLPPAELDAIMRRFIDGDTRILVTTAIIENGLDVPSANTLIVHRADQFGLAQLYQLRGRVGRSYRRAYCYLLVPEDANEDAERRLRVLEHFTELGSGYAIALKDLELRGAGNILGAEQSGFVHAVGLDTYTRLLEKTIRQLRGENGDGQAHHPPPEVSLDGAAYLPDTYVPEPSQKLHLYRRLSRIDEHEQVGELRSELRDRFGPLPPEADRLLATTALRLLGTRVGLERVMLRADEARINFRDGAVPRLTTLQNAFRDQQLDVEVRRPMPLSIVLRRYGAQPLTETVGAALEMLATDEEASAA